MNLHLNMYLDILKKMERYLKQTILTYMNIYS